MSSRNWSLKGRLIIVLGSVLGALWVMATAATVLLTRHEINRVFDSALQETAQRLLPLALHDLHEAAEGDHDGDEGGQSLADEFDGADAYLTYLVRDSTGRVLLRSHGAIVAEYAVPLVRGFSDAGALRIYTQDSRDGRYFVQVAETSARRDVLIRQSLVWLVLPLLVLILAAVVAITLIVRATTRPVMQLQEDIRSRDGTNLAPLPPHNLPVELQPIVDAVNRLLTRLQRALIAERNFAAHSAHELRTPIAAAQAQAQLLLDEAESDAEKKRVHNLLDILTRLGRLVEKLLQLSRAEAGVAVSGSANFREVVGLIVDEYAHRLTGPPSPISLKVHEPLAKTVALDQDALGIVLHNLIDNAIVHGRAGHPVSVILGPGPQMSIVNVGEAIAPEELPRLRERFSRGNTRAGGSGLGLSIVEAIMRETGGTLSIHSPATGRKDGFEVVLSFKEVSKRIS